MKVNPEAGDSHIYSVRTIRIVMMSEICPDGGQGPPDD